VPRHGWRHGLCSQVVGAAIHDNQHTDECGGCLLGAPPWWWWCWCLQRGERNRVCGPCHSMVQHVQCRVWLRMHHPAYPLLCVLQSGVVYVWRGGGGGGGWTGHAYALSQQPDSKWQGVTTCPPTGLPQQDGAAWTQALQLCVTLCKGCACEQGVAGRVSSLLPIHHVTHPYTYRRQCCRQQLSRGRRLRVLVTAQQC
jgi:hypothetical protein